MPLILKVQSLFKSQSLLQPHDFIDRWELLDDPFQSDLCNCCDYGCNQEAVQDLQSGGLLIPLVCCYACNLVDFIFIFFKKP